MAPRRVIKGFKDESWKLSADARVYRHWRRQPITNLIGYLPTVDLGAGYHGPVPAPGCAKDCPKCRWLNSPDPTGIEPGLHRPSSLRLLDELVVYAFHDLPTGFSWETWRPRHIDGNAWNCRADNLEWTVDLSDAAYLTLREAERRQKRGRYARGVAA